VGLWVGVLAAHPLLFFLLGVAFNMLGGSINFLGNDASLQKLVQLLAAVIAMFIAAASPLLLMKFAPVIPVGFGGTQGPSVQPGSWGPNSMSEALDRYRSKADDSGTSSGQANFTSSGGSSSGSSSGASSGGGGSLSAAAASRAGASTGASPGGSAAGGGAAAGGVAVEGLVGAGAAESATGVGAAIGVPTLIAAGAMMAGSVAVGVAQTASDHAIATMGSPGEGEA
jgi:type IV secretion system protein TrbL